MGKAGFAAIILSVLTLAGLARAEGELRALITANDTKGWEAVGRLDIGSRSFCTGALIAPDIVLTAAHCLYSPGTDDAVNARDIVFKAGWRNGYANAERGVRRAIAHPKFENLGPMGLGRVQVDVAILELEAPIRNPSIAPFETHRRPRKGDEVGVVSYGRGRAERPSLQEVCKVLARQAGTLVLNCEVEHGSSGAPVFIMENGEARIVSVISAMAEVRGRTVALAASLDNPLGEVMALLEQAREAEPIPEGRPAVRVNRPEELSTTGGARFLRP
ncbi:MAG: trypsin-like serine protease [Rhodobacteraceae bacterium]|nr:trypsin-like serine protease [Paracoccaceae bacterium]